MNSSTKDPRKFLFETHDFGDKETIAALNRDAPAEPTFSEEELMTAKAESFAQGKAEGLQEAKASIETQLTAILEKAANALDTLCSAEEKREKEKAVIATHMAISIARKLLPGIAKKLAQNEIEAAIATALESQCDEPRIVIRLHDSLIDALKQKIDDIASQKGFAGQIILLADEDLQPTDCRIEWADGGTEKLFDTLYSHIERTILKSIGSQGPRNIESTQKEDGAAPSENVEKSDDIVETTGINP